MIRKVVVINYPDPIFPAIRAILMFGFKTAKIEVSSEQIVPEKSIEFQGTLIAIEGQLTNGEWFKLKETLTELLPEIQHTGS